MNYTSTRDWKVLCWNVRGLNSIARQNAVREKIEHSQCAVICLQETKCETVDHNFIKSFCPRRFHQFAVVPSRGASGGILTIWNSAIFDGQLVDTKAFGIVIHFTSSDNAESWTLVNVYGPCEQQQRDIFVDWLYHLSIPFDANWLLLGDFNFIRSLDNRNLPGGDVNDMFIFNEIIGHLGLLEIPLKGRRFT